EVGDQKSLRVPCIRYHSDRAVSCAWPSARARTLPQICLRRLKVEVVKHEEGHRGFAVLPRRWVVERTNAWFGRFRLLNKEYERSLTSSRADVLMGMTMIMLRRLTVPVEERRE